jgi:hypothetical protein
MKRVNLGRLLPLLLGEHPVARGQRLSEESLQSLIARDLAADIAHHPAKKRAGFISAHHCA